MTRAQPQSRPLMLALILAVLLGVAACGRTLEMTPAMQRAADRYLTLLDRGQYEEVWHAGADIFQNAVTQPDWLQRMAAVHDPLGKAQARALRNAVSKVDPANSPPGEYVMVTFDTRFASGQAVETLVLYNQAAHVGGDQQAAQWRLAGYFVK